MSGETEEERRQRLARYRRCLDNRDPEAARLRRQAEELAREVLGIQWESGRTKPPPA